MLGGSVACDQHTRQYGMPRVVLQERQEVDTGDRVLDMVANRLHRVHAGSHVRQRPSRLDGHTKPLFGIAAVGLSDWW